MGPGKHANIYFRNMSFNYIYLYRIYINRVFINFRQLANRYFVFKMCPVLSMKQVIFSLTLYYCKDLKKNLFHVLILFFSSSTVYIANQLY